MAQYEIYKKTADGKRGKIIEKYTKFSAVLRFNEVGKWSMTGTGLELCPFAENEGVIVYRDGIPFISGYITDISEEADETLEGGEIITWSVEGADDNGMLARRVIIPDPVNLDMTAAAYQTIRDYGGNAILDYIHTQAGEGAKTGREIPNLTVGSDLDLGSIQTYNARLQNLWEFVIGIAEGQALGVRIVWDGTSGEYTANVYTPIDKSEAIIFSREFGNLKSWKRKRSKPGTNALWVAGQGELTERMFSYVEDPSSINTWGRYEAVQDRRDLSNEQDENDPRTPQEILDDTANELLESNKATQGYELELAPLDRIEYRTDWELGDIVKIRAGSAEFSAIIEEVSIDYSAGIETVTPSVGTINRGTISKTYQTIQAISDRVATLERSEGIVDLFNSHDHDGTNTVKISGSNLASAVPISLGGTGATNIANARNNLGVMSTTPSKIEFYPTEGNSSYIDFHYGRSAEDYTSRIIEGPSGRLNVTGDLLVYGNVSGANTADTGWVNLTLLNGWSLYTPWGGSAKYRKIGNFIAIQLYCIYNTSAKGSREAPIANLPAGYGIYGEIYVNAQNPTIGTHCQIRLSGLQIDNDTPYTANTILLAHFFYPIG